MQSKASTSFRTNLREIRWAIFLCVLPIALLQMFYLSLIRLTCRIQMNPESHPANSIFYGTHIDCFLLNVSSFHSKKDEVWLGYHGFLTYMWLAWHMVAGCKVFHFDPRGAKAPFEQILAFLVKYPETALGILTDAGGPYGRVRSSLIRLAKGSNRPLVALRFRTRWKVTVMKHQLPLPFCRIQVTTSDIISSTSIRQGEVEQITEQAERLMISL